MEPEPQSDYEARAAALSADKFLTLLPGAAAQNAGIVFRGKKKKNAAGVWVDAAEITDAWPEVLYIKPGTWADEDEDVEAGCRLLSINGEAVSTFAAAKESLQAGAKAATAANPFIELVWQRGAEEGVPAAQFSSAVQRWNLLQWSVP